MFDGIIFVKCMNCQTKNRLQVRHLAASPSCGQCHAPLLDSELATNDHAGIRAAHATAEGDTAARKNAP